MNQMKEITAADILSDGFQDLTHTTDVAVDLTQFEKRLSEDDASEIIRRLGQVKRITKLTAAGGLPRVFNKLIGRDQFFFKPWKEQLSNLDELVLGFWEDSSEARVLLGSSIGLMRTLKKKIHIYLGGSKC